MPEKALWTRHVGMEALNSVGSTGSCDSMESISSNHSAFSGDGYDHLSAEERECLMFLEETIDSLDNENDSGLSNDELDTEKTANLPASEPMRIPTPNGNDKTQPKSSTLSKSEEWTNLGIDSNRIPQGYHSFPRIVQTSRDEVSKPPVDHKLADSNNDLEKPWHGKPKSLSSINQQHVGESLISEFLILPPPEPFRDPQIIDKRRSVTDPTDAREVRFERALLKSAKISEHKEPAPVLKPSNTKASTPSLFPRVSSPISGSLQTPKPNVEKPVDSQFKQGPPTAPKPRSLPPHIIIKASGGSVSNLDPQKRPRTFSAHERLDKASESLIKVPNSKEHEQARHEALQKLGLEDKSGPKENSSIRSSKPDLTLAQCASDQSQKDATKKSGVINQQEKLDFIGSLPVQPSIVIHKPQDQRKYEGHSDNRLNMKLDELVSGTALLVQKDTNVDESPSHDIKSGIILRNRPSVKTSAQEEETEVVVRPTKPLNEAHMVTDDSPKQINSDNRNSSLVKPVPQLKTDNVSNQLGDASKEAYSGSAVAFKYQKPDTGIKSTSVKASPMSRGITVTEINPITLKTSDHLPNFEKPTQPLNEVHMVSDDSPKQINSDNRNSSLVKPVPHSKADNVSNQLGDASKEAYSGSAVAFKYQKPDTGIKSTSVKASPISRGITVTEINPITLKTSDHLPNFEKSQGKVGSLENINIISTSPSKTFSFPRPKEVLVAEDSPAVVLRDGRDKVAVDKSNRHSTHFEPLTEPHLRFNQSSVPGLKQINIKSNTLERSGVGLSGSILSTEKENQKGSSSFFKKPIFSGNFLRNSRPRPASLGTGKDFASLEPSVADAETTEKRSFFSRTSRSSAPVTSVKITPKGSTEEHRKEALKKLGILKE